MLGPRQVGKTTLLKHMFAASEDVMYLYGDDGDVQRLFSDITAPRLKAIIGDKKTLIIDEAQRIPEMGLKLKIIIDQIPDVQLIATGSSSFELANKLNEPLTGRKWEYKMFPLSFTEMVAHHGLLEEKRMLRHRLIYGYYPEVVSNEGNEKEILKQLSDSYLYKDILMLDNVKRPEKIITLLQALAYQIGSQVSYNELSQMCGMDAKTVEKYINLLEQCYIIFRLKSFSRNHRNELKSSRKIYFYDNGIRNALIVNFSQVENRTDMGALWENFAIAERLKYISYNNIWRNSWFWRTKDQNEIDYIEEGDGNLDAFEFKWNPKTRYKCPSQFTQSYPDARVSLITPDCMEGFIV